MTCQRLRGDQGQVGGIEVIPFGILTFVIAMLVIANAWGVVDARLSTTSAAREAVRTFVEAPDEETALLRAESAATQTFSGHGLDLFGKFLLLNRAEMAEISDRFWSPFCRNGKLPRQGFPDTGHGQEIGGQGIFVQ